MTTPAGVDPRGPRFAAWITSALLLVATVLGLIAAFLNAAFGICVGRRLYLRLRRGR